MDEKETKTVTMPLSEFEQMRRDIQDLKIRTKEDLREKVEKCVGMSIEEIEDFYRIRGESFTYHMDCVKDYHLQTLKQKDALLDNYMLSCKVTEKERDRLKEKYAKLEQDLELLRKEYDIYYNRCVELKEKINKLQEKKWWQFWK